MSIVPSDPEHVTPRSRYFEAVHEAEADVRDALSHVRANEDEGKITTLEAANERIILLERHLARLHALRIKHLLGDES